MSYSGEIIIISCDETELDINGTFFLYQILIRARKLKI